MRPNDKEPVDTASTQNEVRRALEKLLRLVAKAVVERLKHRQKKDRQARPQ